MFFRQGAPRLGEGALRTGQGLAALRAAAAGHLSPAGQLQVATALDMLAAAEARMEVLRTQLRDAARHLRGAKVLTARLSGAGPVTGLALTCWLAGAGRFSSARKAVRFTGLDVTVWSSDRKGPPGRLSRQGPPVLRYPRRRGHPVNHHVAGAAPKPRGPRQGWLPLLPPGRHGWSPRTERPQPEPLTTPASPPGHPACRLA